MDKKQFNNFEYYESERLHNEKTILHFFSTKIGNDNNAEFISTQLNIDNIVVPKQTHSANIAIVTHNNKHKLLTNIDALITNEKGICICVKTADCTPILLFDQAKKVVAAIHSGWRGTVQNITGKTIQKMNEYFNSKLEDIKAAIGPCISQKNYEVGSEVVLQFENLFPKNNEILDTTGYTNGNAKLNVRMAIEQQLLQEGILSENIDCSVLCSFENSTDFYSARRDGPQTGRMLNGILIK